MQLAPSLHRLGSGVVNSYLIEDAGQVTIIDAGMPGFWKDLEAELASMGKTAADVRALLLTHSDSDHVGFAERLRREAGVPVHVHELEAAHARGETKGKSPGWGTVRVLPVLRFLAFGMTHGGLKIEPIREVKTYAGGETLDVPGSPRVIHLPGHSGGSVAIHAPSVDAIFVGDAMTTLAVTTGETGPRPAPFSENPEQALASLARLDGVEARWLLPGHGQPWTGGVATAIAAYKAVAAGA
jgi:glyoxylase-like metal-dependent hydrolase (beta-lactamase superfamily II)